MWPGQLVAMATEKRDPAAVTLIQLATGARHVTSAHTHARIPTKITASFEASDDYRVPSLLGGDWQYRQHVSKTLESSRQSAYPAQM